MLETGKNFISSIGNLWRERSPFMSYYKTAISDTILTPVFGAFLKSLKGIFKCNAQCNAKVCLD